MILVEKKERIKKLMAYSKEVTRKNSYTPLHEKYYKNLLKKNE